MGYFSIGKKIIILSSFVFLSSIGGVAVAKDFDTSPRDQVFLLSPKKTFEYYCSVGTHRAMGMKGTLKVE